MQLTDSDFTRLYTYVKNSYGIDLSKKKQLISSRLNNMLIQQGYRDFIGVIERDNDLAERGFVVIISSSERVTSGAFDIVEIKERVRVEKIIRIPHEGLSPVYPLAAQFQAPFAFFEREKQAVEAGIQKCLFFIHEVPR